MGQDRHLHSTLDEPHAKHDSKQIEVRVERVDCALCGSSETTDVQTASVLHFGERHAFHVVRCARCALVYLNPRPVKEEIGAFYPKEYHAELLRVVNAGWSNPIMRRGMEAVRRRRSSPVVPGGQLLDIGCNFGLYLQGQRERGWSVQGIEIDEQAAEYARSEFGLHVQVGDAGDVLPTFPDAHFDVVTLWHVLEHLYNPAEILAHIYRILKPGGVMMLEVPNYASPTARVFGEYWFPLEVPRHLYHFTPRTLRAILDTSGLNVTSVTGVPAPEAISWSLRALRQRGQNDAGSDSLSLNPMMAGLFFPLSWSMARFGRSDAMAARAIKPSPAGMRRESK